eukprot:jgi/Mesvir1/3265/Mv16400-RA.1
MVRSAVRVVVRTKPTTKFANEAITLHPDRQTIAIHAKRATSDGPQNHQENYQFKVDEVLHGASQEQVFDTACRSLVESALEGFNGTILAYGQTGAGKTYTMSGGKEAYAQRGVIPRALSYLFQWMRARPQVSVSVRVSYVELYNEMFLDLLSGTSAAATPASGGEGAPAGNPDIVILEDVNHGITVRGLSMPMAATEQEALGLLFEGETNRAIAEHQLNKASSRSHAVFTIHLEIRSRAEGDERIMTSKLNLVDLAGSERLSKTGSHGQVAKEASYINKSLTFLEQVIVALGDRSRDHIPYRSSRLTHMLKDSLGGNCKTVMVANIWGEAAHIDETISTLRFATRMMRVSNEVTLNVKQDPDQLIRKYEREIRDLKQELAMHDAFSNRTGVSYAAYSDAQRTELGRQVAAFLRSEASADDPLSVAPLELSSIRHVKEILLACRRIFKAGGVHVGGGAPGGVSSHAPASQPRSAGGSRSNAYDSQAPSSQEPFANGSHGGASGDAGMGGYRGAQAVPALWPQASSTQPSRGPATSNGGDAGPGRGHAVGDAEEGVGDAEGDDDYGDGMCAPADARPVSASARPPPDGPPPRPPLDTGRDRPLYREQDASGGLNSPPSAAPLRTKSNGPRRGPSALQANGVARPGGDSWGGTPEPGGSKGGEPPDKAEAFEEYKRTLGAEIASIQAENKAALKEKKRRSKELATTINSCKRDIDNLKVQIDEKKAARDAAGGGADTPEGAEVLDEEDLALLLRLKEQKKEYRTAFEELKVVKSEVEYTQQLVDQSTQQLLLDFSQWYEKTYFPDLAVASSGHEEGGASAHGRPAYDDESATSSPVRSTRDDGGEALVLIPTTRAREPAEPADMHDPEAAAFYSAQRALKLKVNSQKKKGGGRGTTTLR